MPRIVPITVEITAIYKQVRLAALLDTPSAFGSTYARERLLSAEDWLKRCENLDGRTGIGFIAMEAGEAIALVGCLLDQNDPSRADIVSMWVDPRCRRSGLSYALVDAVRDWASSRKVATLRLMVTSSNDIAIAFYERYGFTKTGRTEPYPNDPALFEFEMVHSTIA